MTFGYPWWLSYGHLAVTAITLPFLWLAIARRWPRWMTAVFGIATIWSLTAFVIVRFVIDINGPGTLPTESFLRSGSGRVLDLGAGTGRSSIMVLRARPHVTLVASDLFGKSFDQHFGSGEDPQSRLLANLKAARVDDRASIVRTDMRKLPFPDDSFDAVVSAYAIDHLNRAGITATISEANRVVKPGGEFLMMLVGNEPWSKFAFGPLLAHGGLRGAGWWSDRLREAGFQVVEQGTRPLTLYLLARRP